MSGSVPLRPRNAAPQSDLPEQGAFNRLRAAAVTSRPRSQVVGHLTKQREVVQIGLMSGVCHGSSLPKQINLPIVLMPPPLPPCGLPLLEGLHLGDANQCELAQLGEPAAGEHAV